MYSSLGKPCLAPPCPGQILALRGKGDACAVIALPALGPLVKTEDKTPRAIKVAPKSTIARVQISKTPGTSAQPCVSFQSPGVTLSAKARSRDKCTLDKTSRSTCQHRSPVDLFANRLYLSDLHHRCCLLMVSVSGMLWPCPSLSSNLEEETKCCAREIGMNTGQSKPRKQLLLESTLSSSSLNEPSRTPQIHTPFTFPSSPSPNGTPCSGPPKADHS